MLHEYVMIGEGCGEKYAFNTATISRMEILIVKGLRYAAVILAAAKAASKNNIDNTAAVWHTCRPCKPKLC